MRTYENLIAAIAASGNTEESLKIANELLLDIRETLLSMSAAAPIEEEAEKDPDPLDAVSVYDLEISTRAFKGLLNANILKLSELRHLTVVDLVRKSGRNVGEKTIKEIVEAVKVYGIDMPAHP
jgi:DNA-directed RNA polymerase alpha subunit